MIKSMNVADVALQSLLRTLKEKGVLQQSDIDKIRDETEAASDSVGGTMAEKAKSIAEIFKI